MNTSPPPPPGLRAAPNPQWPLPPPPPPAASGESDQGARPAGSTLALVGCVAAAVMAVCWVAWFVLEDTLARAEPDRGVPWVPMAAMAAAGALWPAVDRGPATARRVATGLVAGAAAGAIGGFVAGRADTHLEALERGGEIDPVHILLWAALGMVAWTVTLGAASAATNRWSTLIGAALGGAVSGGVMGALLGQFAAGSPLRVTPTDIWWSVPLEAADIGPRVLPVLVVGLALPLLVASPTRSMGVVLGRAGVVLAVLVGASVVFVQQDDPATVGSGGPGGSPGVPVPAGPRVADDDDVAEPAGDSGNSSVEVTAVPATVPAAPTEAPTVPVDTIAAEPSGVVPFPFDPGFEVYAAYDGTASNAAGETATVAIAFGGPHVASSAYPVSTGEIACPLGPNDAFVPFSVEVTARGLAETTTLRVGFGQGGVEGADVLAHPLSVQWNHAGGRQCSPGTAVATADDAPGSVWSTLRADEPQYSSGYLVVRDYFDPVTGNATAISSAGTGVSVVVNDSPTSSEWTLTGGTVGVVHDPAYGDYGAVLFG